MSSITLSRPPEDPETLIMFEAQVEISDQKAWHQIWRWGMYQAHSLIFPTATAKDLNDDELKAIAQASDLAHIDSRFTFKRRDEWIFVNFNFEDLND